MASSVEVVVKMANLLCCSYLYLLQRYLHLPQKKMIAVW